MKATSPKRVGLFVCGYPLGSATQVPNVALILARHGYEVDILIYRAQDKELITFETDLIHICDLSDGIHNVKGKFLSRLVSITHTLRTVLSGHREYLVIPRYVVQRARKIVSAKRYHCFIGIESHGLILAGLLGRTLKVPFIYYSLELYLSDHPYFSGFGFRTVKKLERKYHHGSVATIIQDKDRAERLYQDNKVVNPETYFVPVSLLGKPVRSKTRWLYDNLGIPNDKKIILQYGRIHAHRLSPEVVQASQNFPDEWAVVMHGPASDEEITDIQQYNTKKKVFFSTYLMPIHDVPQLVASADIGLVLYLNDCANNYLVGSSSEKLAYYLKCGLPVITNDFPSLRHVIQKYQCGVFISSLDELAQAIGTVFASYETFRQNAFRGYEEHYEFSKHFAKVIERIDALSSGA